MENAKKQSILASFWKCDILRDFQTLCSRRLQKLQSYHHQTDKWRKGKWSVRLGHHRLASWRSGMNHPQEQNHYCSLIPHRIEKKSSKNASEASENIKDKKVRNSNITNLTFLPILIWHFRPTLISHFWPTLIWQFSMKIERSERSHQKSKIKVFKFIRIKIVKIMWVKNLKFIWIKNVKLKWGKISNSLSKLYGVKS